MGSPVTQFQILAKNPDAAAAFYERVFGWKIDTGNALGYRTVQTGDARGAQGGIWPAPPDAPAMVQLFVEVGNVQSVADEVKTAGGNVIMQPQVLPDGDEMALVLDPQGIPFGLFKPRAKV